MKIDADACIACGLCVPYCPMGAIRVEEVAEVDLDECVECGVCYRSKVCPVDAFVPETPTWPRSVRNLFSDPTTEFKETRVPGRGTEEMKTNDVTGRLKRGRVGVGIELGRPGIGARFYDLDKVTRAMAGLGAQFEPKNPVTHLMENTDTGEMHRDILNEKVMTAIVECSFPTEKLEEVLTALAKVAGQVDTVFSVDCTSRVEPDGSFPLEGTLRELGIPFYPNGKTNVGLGRAAATGGSQ